MELDIATLAPFALALIVAGAIGGVLAGLLGVGGGIVIVPVLYHLFGLLGIDDAVRMHVAVGTSLATIIPTAIMSTRAHHARGAVDTGLLREWGPFIALGVVIGAVLSGFAPAFALTLIFGVVALLVAAHMGLGRKDAALAASLPGRLWRRLIASVIGFFSVLMGIGGGTLSVPILTAFSYPIRRAVGTAAAIGLIIAIPGAIGAILFGLDIPNRPPFSLGYVSLVGFALIVPATMATAPLGARIAHTINQALLKRLFALFLFITGLRMLWDVFAG